MKREDLGAWNIEYGFHVPLTKVKDKPLAGQYSFSDDVYIFGEINVWVTVRFVEHGGTIITKRRYIYHKVNRFLDGGID